MVEGIVEYKGEYYLIEPDFDNSSFDSDSNHQHSLLWPVSKVQLERSVHIQNKFDKEFETYDVDEYLSLVKGITHQNIDAIQVAVSVVIAEESNQILEIIYH